MKKIYSVFAIMVLPILMMAQGINFEHGTLKEALKKGKAEDKLVFIDGYAVWCGPCKKMAKTVFLEKEVGNYFDENLIALKVDVERGEGPIIKRKYGIASLPGYVFLDGDGRVVYRFSGAMPTASFMNEVKLAVSFAKGSNSVGRLSERYDAEKNDEKFVRMYLDKLKESKSKNYIEVLEHYLTIQKSFEASSKEMVVLLADHNEEIIFGSKADQIIQENNGSDAWKLYVRKDVREVYQRLGSRMVENTTDYAIATKDTSLLELTMQRAAGYGYKDDDAQRKRTYTFYYLQTGDGEKYKASVYENNETFIKSIKVKELRDYYQDWKKRKAAGEQRAQSSRPHSVKTSQNITYMVSSYARFAETDQEKKDVVRWMKVAYDIIPGKAKVMSDYASVLYLFGKDKSEAIKIKEEAYKIAVKEGAKSVDAMKLDLEAMKEGGEIFFK